MISWLLIIVIYYCLIYLIKKHGLFKRDIAKMKGRKGESLVESTLRRLPASDYKVIHNIMLKNGSNLTQIDHIIISIYGIFVIETKHYQGFISGSDNRENWCQSFGKKRYLFRNPIKQNIAHVLAIKNNLKINQKLIIPIVVFTGKCKLNIHSKNHVVHLPELYSIIMNYRKSVLSPEEVIKLTTQLSDLNIDSVTTRKEHIKQINEKRNHTTKKHQSNNNS